MPPVTRMGSSVAPAAGSSPPISSRAHSHSHSATAAATAPPTSGKAHSTPRAQSLPQGRWGMGRAEKREKAAVTA